MTAAKSADPVEMPQSAVFHLGPNYLPNCPFRGFPNSKGVKWFISYGLKDVRSIFILKLYSFILDVILFHAQRAARGSKIEMVIQKNDKKCAPTTEIYLFFEMQFFNALRVPVHALVINQCFMA